ncbi:hypothetical protein Cwoe_5745 [Conexibacter woesei DSM 14684]|uniref:CopG domain protein DNA-binding domain protein n=2 Tax=Conexibacter TaxID=191494 RepID=D3F1W5_CONWI|nr:hypothetical protein Cwoe_5745 [Conexibacter woesei DSM 14684]
MTIPLLKAPPSHVYGLHMLNERLQILVTPLQRQRLEREARERGVSVGSLVREAIDARFGGYSVEERLEVLERFRRMRAKYLSIEEMDRIVEEERNKDADAMLRQVRR